MARDMTTIAQAPSEICDDEPAVTVEGAGHSRRRSGLARVGDRAQHAGPGLEQAEPDRLPWPGIAGPGQGMPQRVGQQLRHHDRDVWAAFCHAPLVQGGDGEVPGGADRSGIRAERACGDRGRQAQRARAGSGGGRHLPLARSAVSAAGLSQRQPALPAG